MKKSKQQPIADILNKSSFTLGNLRHKVVELVRFNERLQAVLPEGLRPHCQAANYRDQKLIVLCDSAAWSTRLRFMEHDLLKKLKTEDHFTIKSIQCIVRQTPASQEEQFWEATPISGESRTHIKRLADSMEDNDLKMALLKLIR